jgi:hypothetical protein
MRFINFTPPEEGADVPINLDGTDYILRYRYHGRTDRWMLIILDADENVLASGIKLLPLVDLYSTYLNTQLPPGELVLSKLNGDSPATLADMGDLARVVYYTAVDMVGINLYRDLRLEQPQVTAFVEP